MAAKKIKAKIKAQFIKQPRYYNEFSCTGGDCPMNCCFGWSVVEWKNAEVQKLRNADCSEKIRSLIDTSFVPHYKDKQPVKKFKIQLNDNYKDVKLIEDISFNENVESYKIKMNEKRSCSFLTEDNFCSIQLELGAEYLSRTCRVYPRRSVLVGNTIYMYCNLSCYHVVDLLCNEKDSMILENFENIGQKIENINIDNVNDVINHPELKYRRQLLDLFYDIISDDSHSLEASIVLGALAAHGLTKIINNGEYDKIPDFIKNIKKQLDDPKQTEKLESFKPKTEVRIGFARDFYKNIVRIDLSDIIKVDVNISVEKFLDGERKFNEAYSDRPFALRNIALNLMLDLKMPFRDVNVSLFENYCYFAAAVSVIKFAADVAYTSDKDRDKAFKTLSAYVSRSFAHDDLKVKRIIELLNSYHCTSPAYLLLILK